MIAWRPVLGFEGLYEVSDCGQVRSPTRGVIRAHSDTKGYRQVRLTNQDGRAISRRVHRLVLEAFVGARPPGSGASHRNGDRTNNRLTNLVWETAAENNARKYDHGTVLRGEDAGPAKLTSAKIIEIRTRAAKGETSYQLARVYGVASKTIRDAVQRLTWRHV